MTVSSPPDDLSPAWAMVALDQLMAAYPARDFTFNPAPWEGYLPDPQHLRISRSLWADSTPEVLDGYAVGVLEQVAYSYPPQPLQWRGAMISPQRLLSEVIALHEAMAHADYTGPPPDYLDGWRSAISVAQTVWSQPTDTAAHQQALNEALPGATVPTVRGLVDFLAHEARLWPSGRGLIPLSIVAHPAGQSPPFQVLLQIARAHYASLPPACAAFQDSAQADRSDFPARSPQTGLPSRPNRGSQVPRGWPPRPSSPTWPPQHYLPGSRRTP